MKSYAIYYSGFLVEFYIEDISYYFAGCEPCKLPQEADYKKSLVRDGPTENLHQLADAVTSTSGSVGHHPTKPTQASTTAQQLLNASIATTQARHIKR